MLGFTLCIDVVKHIKEVRYVRTYSPVKNLIFPIHPHTVPRDVDSTWLASNSAHRK